MATIAPLGNSAQLVACMTLRFALEDGLRSQETWR
jgi:hypothetical protein